MTILGTSIETIDHGDPVTLRSFSISRRKKSQLEYSTDLKNLRLTHRVDSKGTFASCSTFR